MTHQERIEDMQIQMSESYKRKAESECLTAEAVGQQQVLEAIARREAAELERDAKKRWIEQSREYQRPFRMVQASMTFDVGTGQWVAACGDVSATGDTPEMAADNFDHRWLYGDGQTG
jgi:chromosome condensin MukBEF ATPase and DNA-binding subunit MukB